MSPVIVVHHFLFTLLNIITNTKAILIELDLFSVVFFRLISGDDDPFSHFSRFVLMWRYRRCVWVQSTCNATELNSVSFQWKIESTRWMAFHDVAEQRTCYNSHTAWRGRDKQSTGNNNKNVCWRLKVLPTSACTHECARCLSHSHTYTGTQRLSMAAIFPSLEWLKCSNTFSVMTKSQKHKHRHSFA